jgi:hypothetical protein
MRANKMDQPLPRATPSLAKAVWQSQKWPSARSVARALTLSGRPVHFTTNRWRGRDWRVATIEHPLVQARSDLNSALALVTGNPTSTIDDLIGDRPARNELEHLTDAQLLRRAARELAMAVVMVAHVLMRQAALVLTRPGEVGILFRSLAACAQAITAGFAQATNVQAARPEPAETHQMGVEHDPHVAQSSAARET